MMVTASTLRIGTLSALPLVLASGAWGLGQQTVSPKASPPVQVTTSAKHQQEPSTAKSAAAAVEKTEPATPSDAERIAELSRFIELDEKHLAQLKEQLADPESEFHKAEAAFNTADQQLKELMAQLERLNETQQPDKVHHFKKEIADLQQVWMPAKDRFELALEERKTLQAQVATREKKIAGDKAELARLKGEAIVAPLSKPEQTAVGQQSMDMPASSPAEETQTPLTPPDAVADNAQSQQAKPETASPPASETLRKARKEVQKTQQSLAEAEAEVQQARIRLEEMDNLIEREQELLETRRRMVNNAWQRMANLNEELRGNVAQGKREELPRLTQEIKDAEAAYRSAQHAVEQSDEVIQRARSDREALDLQLAQAQEQVRQLQNKAQMTWVKTLGVEVVDWIRRHGLRLLLIIVGLFILKYLIRTISRRIVRLLVHTGRGSQRERENRAKTLAGVFNNAASVAAISGAILLIVTEINPSWIGPLIASLAVVGIAVGLGAQNLVRDYFFGFVLLMENQYGIDDVVKLSGVAGLVERVTLRLTVLRDLDGVVHFVPHGQITTVTNMTHGWSRALFEIGVAYKENVDDVMDVLMKLGHEMKNDPNFGPLILDEPKMLGVDRFDDSAVVIKFFLKTRPLQQFSVRRELNRRIKNKFDEMGIEIPFPHRTIFHRQAADSNRQLTYVERS